MAFLPGIFSRAPAPAAAPAAAAPAAPAAPASGPVAAQMTGPANPAANPAAMLNTPPTPPAGGPQNPLDAFTTMFQPKAADPNAPKPVTLQDPILTPLDPAAFRAEVGKANFASGIPAETMQKAMSGDTTAFADAINHAAREAFAAAAQLSHSLSDHSARTAAERLNSTLDGRLRTLQIRNQTTSNEALAHPAVAPMLNAVKTQIAMSNPQLSPDQVQAQAETYFTQMADVLTAPKRQAAQAAATPAQPDFSSYLN